MIADYSVFTSQISCLLSLPMGDMTEYLQNFEMGGYEDRNRLGIQKTLILF